VGLAQLAHRDVRRGLHDDLDEVGELLRELAEVDPLRDVPQVDAEHLAVLEAIERLGAGGVSLRFRERVLQFVTQLLDGLAPVQARRVDQHGEEIVVLHAEEVFPEEAADAHELGERFEGRVGFEVAQVLHAVRHRQHLLGEGVELAQRLRRVRGAGEEIREVFDERGDDAEVV